MASGGVEVREAVSGRDRRRFVDLPYDLYRHNRTWVPPLKRDVKALLSPRHPFFEHAELGLFLAVRAGQVVGRVAAISDRRHNETHHDKVGFFGFFDCLDDAEAAARLLDEAEGWCRARGHDCLRGPVSPSLNHECGTLVAGFAEPPTLMMPYNPPHHGRLLEATGLVKARDLLVYHTGRGIPPVPARLERVVAAVKRRKQIELRPLNLERFDDEIESIKRIYNGAWERNWGFVPMTEREMDLMAAELRPHVIPELMPVAEVDGQVVAIGIALPDLNVALRHNRSGGVVSALPRLLWHRHIRGFRRVRVLALGVAPEYRGVGVDAALYHWMWSHALERKMRWAEAGWVLEDNRTMNSALTAMGFEPYRRYRLYERGIPGSAG